MFDLKGIDRRLMPYAKVFQQGNGFALGVNISSYDEINVTLYHGKCVNSNYIFCDRIWVFPFFSTYNRGCVFTPSSVYYNQTFDYDRMRCSDAFKISLRKLRKQKEVISLVPPFRLFNKIKIVIYFFLMRRWCTPNETYNILMEYMIWMDEIQSQIKKIIKSS